MDFGLRLKVPGKRLNIIPTRVDSLSLIYYIISELNITNNKINYNCLNFYNIFTLTLLL